MTTEPDAAPTPAPTPGPTPAPTPLSTPAPAPAPASPRPRLNRIDLRDPRVQLVFAIAIGVVPLFCTALASWTLSEPSFGTLGDGLAMIGASIGSVAAMLMLIIASGEPREEFGIVPFRPRDLLIGALWTAPQLWAPAAIIVALTTPPGVTALDAAISPEPLKVTVTGGVAAWGVLTLGVVCNSFAEELVIRAVIFTRIRLLTGSAVQASVWSSALFASYHIYQGVIGAVHIFLSGLLFAAAFALHRNVWVVIVTHTAVNIAIAVFYN